MTEMPLIASYWTIAGASHPGAADERSPWSLFDRMEAAAVAGFDGIGLLITDVRALLRDGAVQRFRDRFEQSGLSLLEMEVLTGWYREGSARASSDLDLSDFVAFAELMPVRHLKIGGEVSTEVVDHSALVAGLRRVGDRLRHTGTNLTLEFMPFSNIPTLDLARRAVEEAGRDDIGLLLDVWHVARAGVPYSELEGLPEGLVNHVEIDDAPKQPWTDLAQETIHGRLLPGKGTLEVSAFLEAVVRGGYRGPIGVEVISEAHRALPLRDAAGAAAEAAKEVLASVETR